MWPCIGQTQISTLWQKSTSWQLKKGTWMIHDHNRHIIILNVTLALNNKLKKGLLVWTFLKTCIFLVACVVDMTTIILVVLSYKYDIVWLLSIMSKSFAISLSLSYLYMSFQNNKLRSDSLWNCAAYPFSHVNCKSY